MRMAPVGCLPIVKNRCAIMKGEEKREQPKNDPWQPETDGRTMISPPNRGQLMSFFYSDKKSLNLLTKEYNSR